MELAKRFYEALAAGDMVVRLESPEALQAARAALGPLVDPELEVDLVGPEYLNQPLVYRGMDGYIEAWRDWLEPYESYHVESEEYIDAGDKVVQLVRQVGRTRVSSVPIETRSAGVFTFRDGKLVRAEFHLERESAMKAAGLSE